jgi:hypothetical protein
MLSHLYQILQVRAERFPSSIALGAEEGLRWRTLDSRQLWRASTGWRQIWPRAASDLATGW